MTSCDEPYIGEESISRPPSWKKARMTSAQESRAGDIVADVEGDPAAEADERQLLSARRDRPRQDRPRARGGGPGDDGGFQRTKGRCRADRAERREERAPTDRVSLSHRSSPSAPGPVQRDGTAGHSGGFLNRPPARPTTSSRRSNDGEDARGPGVESGRAARDGRARDPRARPGLRPGPGRSLRHLPQRRADEGGALAGHRSTRACPGTRSPASSTPSARASPAGRPATASASAGTAATAATATPAAAATSVSAASAAQVTGITYDGGYADYMIAPAVALARIPDGLSAVEAAPLMCAGVTTFNALRHSGAQAGRPRRRPRASAASATSASSSRRRWASTPSRSRAARTRSRWRGSSARASTSTARRRIPPRS